MGVGPRIRHRRLGIGIDHAQHGGRLPGIARFAVGLERRLQNLRLVIAHAALRRQEAAGGGHLAHHALDPLVDGGHGQGMAAAVAAAPDADALAVHLGAAAQVGNGGSEILDLPLRIDFLAWLAVAAAQVAEIKGQRRQACSTMAAA